MRIVFVHGAFVRDGAWWWRPTADVLAEHGLRSSAAVLPSCESEPRGDLRDDAAAVRELLDASAEPALLVGHSYGGMVITQAGDHPAVHRLVYVTSFLPEAGEALAGFGTGEPPPWHVSHGDGTASVREELVRPLFAQDFDDATYAGAAGRLTAQNEVVFGQPVTTAAWRRIPSTYVVCAEDRATPPAKQREQAARATDVVELPVAHHPFVTRPDLVAGLLQTMT
ncbi:alpha/beta fold hydrolase [Amycolatopsis australiensis]|uniref:Pimeloyl-ACP methyl ester carboxylesterase n=1 Tax=Amycolatopsis australiensis TaxID=546364 RepID=A0A1K1PYS5_9PSEU|nr:alpha/beta hydrolase [Amycolatopsis australiensis]SFW52006.1 Pimeloyl-ACP methyl ester carboxylesterase [Amycolatopsis australiensis]